MPDTIERGIEPLVSMVRIHPVIHANRSNLRFDKDTTRFDPRIGSLKEFDLTGFWHGEDFVVFPFGHEVPPFGLVLFCLGNRLPLLLMNNIDLNQVGKLNSQPEQIQDSLKAIECRL